MKNKIPTYVRSGTWECAYSLMRFVKAIEAMEEDDGLQLTPDFQRERVWTEKQQVSYIEHILSGGESGRVIYLNNPNWNTLVTGEYAEMVCVDGLQRITAIRRFVLGEIQAHGYYYYELGKEWTGIINGGMRININDLPTKKAVLTWYLEMNGGGTPHTEEELSRVRELLEKEGVTG